MNLYLYYEYDEGKDTLVCCEIVKYTKMLSVRISTICSTIYQFYLFLVQQMFSMCIILHYSEKNKKNIKARCKPFEIQSQLTSVLVAD